MQTVDNILRWHGPEEVLPALPEGDLELLRLLRAIVPPDCFDDDLSE
jgi:hypothetical protein